MGRGVIQSDLNKYSSSIILLAPFAST